jgi:hypothetical protein
MNRDSTIRREVITMRRKTGPKPAPPSQEELFREAYMAALTGCCAQFERPTQLRNGKPFFSEGDLELLRARQLCLRAWNVASYSVGLFSQEKEIQAFNDSVNLGSAEE